MNFTIQILGLASRFLFSLAALILFRLSVKMPLSLVRQARMPLLLLFSCFFVHTLSIADPSDQFLRKSAIFVENRAGSAFNDKVSVLEDFITSRITEKGFSVLSREVVINSLKSYSSKESKVSDGELSGTGLDKLLSDSTTTLRLAQMMGVDYIIVASITSYGTEKRAFEGYGVKTVNHVHTLRISYKILEAAEGSSLVADTVKVSKAVRFIEGNHTEDSDMINEMLDDASVMISESLGKKRIIQPPSKPDLIEITIACGMQDLAQLPVSIPDIRLTEDGTVVIGETMFEMQLLDVTVDLNGTVVGSAPDTFKVPPGLNKIRLSREGFVDWERTINCFDGQKLKVALQLSNAGYARWKDNTAFLHNLKNGEKLTDATVKSIEGAAQMLRQSGFKVDVKGDIKLDIEADKKSGLFKILNILY